jgi:L-methionine (R)-S-oxide reductase
LHELRIEHNSNKEIAYNSLLPQIEALVSGEQDLTANLANISAALKSAFNWWWVGFYLVKENELLLGPFQGPVACTRIGLGKGVCGSAWQQAQSIIVADVEKFPGHIACSSASKSEIVVPIIINEKVIGVLDVDSEHLNHFDNTDQLYLEKLIRNISSVF